MCGMTTHPLVHGCHNDAQAYSMHKTWSNHVCTKGMMKARVPSFLHRAGLEAASHPYIPLHLCLSSPLAIPFATFASEEDLKPDEALLHGLLVGTELLNCPVNELQNSTVIVIITSISPSWHLSVELFHNVTLSTDCCLMLPLVV